MVPVKLRAKTRGEGTSHQDLEKDGFVLLQQRIRHKTHFQHAMKTLFVTAWLRTSCSTRRALHSHSPLLNAPRPTLTRCPTVTRSRTFTRRPLTCRWPC